MSTTTGKRTAKVKLTLTKRTVETLQPADKAWIAWDDRLIGFGVRVQPSGGEGVRCQLPHGKRRPEGAQPAHRLVAAVADSLDFEHQYRSHAVPSGFVWDTPGPRLSRCGFRPVSDPREGLRCRRFAWMGHRRGQCWKSGFDPCLRLVLLREFDSGFPS